MIVVFNSNDKFIATINCFKIYQDILCNLMRSSYVVPCTTTPSTHDFNSWLQPSSTVPCTAKPGAKCGVNYVIIARQLSRKTAVAWMCLECLDEKAVRKGGHFDNSSVRMQHDRSFLMLHFILQKFIMHNIAAFYKILHNTAYYFNNL